MNQCFLILKFIKNAAIFSPLGCCAITDGKSMKREKAETGPPAADTKTKGSSAAAWAYLVCCADGSLYAGWTNNLERRLEAHNAGKGAKYTRGRRPVRLVWAEGFTGQRPAMAREAGLKKLSRAEKEALAGTWKGLNRAPDT
jgi:putative endonuclease